MLAGVLSMVLSCCGHRRGSAGGFTPPLGEGPVVHILLSSGRYDMKVGSVQGGVWLAGRREGYFEAGELTVAASRRGIEAGADNTGAREVYFLPFDDIFEFEGRSYRGKLKVLLEDDGSLRTFEAVHLEDYIRGVLPVEIYPFWPMDAIVAQAVAVRTFVLNMIRDPKTRYWLTRLDLAYRGAAFETERTDAAVELSAGMVLTYDNALFPAFFHSTCGGATASARSVFDAHDIPPLRSVQCGRCMGSRHYRWEASFPLREISEKVFSDSGTVIRSISTSGHDSGGRPEFVVINGTERLRASEFRLALGTMRLKSTRFEVSISDGEAHFRGMGFGHGVGLCQWGAYGLARAGYGWEEILHHYYPEAEVRLLEGLAH